jgi:tetratricopeptide (TPR) repeat protein
LEIAKRFQPLDNDFVKAKLQLGFSQNALELDKNTLSSETWTLLNGSVYEILNAVLAYTINEGQERFRAESYASMAHLYRINSKNADSLALTDKAIELAVQSNAKELLAQLYAQKGDLLRIQGDNVSALAAYEIAVRELFDIRADLPLNMPDGRSSINVMIDPIHRGYVDLLLKSAEGIDEETQRAILFKVIGNMEIIKEADM